MTEFFVTLIISSQEEEKTIKFLIEANTLEEAVENIKTDLDID